MKASLVAALFAVVAVVSGAALADENKDEPGKGKESKHHSKHSGQSGESYFHKHGYTRLNIPEGHYPAPGECRIWYPDRPPGQQPPPIKCGQSVPPGGWLIQHPPELPNRVHITVYEPQRPGVVHAVGEFDIGSGVLVRVVINR